MPKAPSADRVQRQIGRKIQAARKNAKLTQEKAAARSGIEYKRWQRLEAGDVNATVKTLYRVATALGLTLWELLATET